MVSGEDAWFVYEVNRNGLLVGERVLNARESNLFRKVLRYSHYLQTLVCKSRMKSFRVKKLCTSLWDHTTQHLYLSVSMHE